MSYFVAVGFVILLVALVVTLDGTLALMAIDRLAQSEGYTEIQSVISLHCRSYPVLTSTRALSHHK
jgi:hypothetical protein